MRFCFLDVEREIKNHLLIVRCVALKRGATFNGARNTCPGFRAPLAAAAAPRGVALAAVQSLEENGPRKDGLGCYNQSARPLCSHGIIPLDLRRVELFKQMAKIIRVAGVSVRCSVSSMLPDMTHVTSSSQHDAGGDDIVCRDRVSWPHLSSC